MSEKEKYSAVDTESLLDSLLESTDDRHDQFDTDIDSSFDSQDLEAFELLKRRYNNDTETRDSLAKKTTRLIIGWLCFVGIVLVLCAIGFFRLSDTVLVTLLATTTVNVLGLAHTVLKGYFQYMSQDIDFFRKRRQRNQK